MPRSATDDPLVRPKIPCPTCLQPVTWSKVRTQVRGPSGVKLGVVTRWSPEDHEVDFLMRQRERSAVMGFTEDCPGSEIVAELDPDAVVARDTVTP